MLRWNVTCIHGWQYGGGLLIVGTATLTDTNVYANRADKVRLGTFFHIAPLERYACAHDWQSGGGLFIHGTATLTNTHVYSNQAGDVRSPFELFMSFHPFPCARTLRVCSYGSQEGGGLFIVGPLATAGAGSSESLWGNAVGTANLANTNVYDNQADNVRLSTPLNSQTSEFILL